MCVEPVECWPLVKEIVPVSLSYVPPVAEGLSAPRAV